jgi:hypothetical protein
MSDALVHMSNLPDAQFVDQVNRKFPIRDQVDVDRAAAELAGKFMGGPKADRRRLVDLARERDLLVPVAFTAEVEDRRVRLKQIGYDESTIDRERAELLAESGWAGVAALAKKGLKPNPVETDLGGTANFSGQAEAPLTAADRDQCLAMTDAGRDSLRSRGLREGEINDLRQAGTQRTSW